MTAQQPAFVPKQASLDGPGDRQFWSTRFVNASLERIQAAQTTEAAQAQALTEQVVLLHSIRRILIWTLILIPVTLTTIGIILLLLGQQSTPVSCGPYGTGC